MRNDTRARLTASTNNRGETRNFVFVATTIILTAIIGMLVFTLIKLSTNTRDVVLDQQAQYELTSNAVTKAIFSIASVRFADSEAASCTLSDSYQRPTIMIIRFKNLQVPDSCSFFVNEVLLTTERRLAPDCRYSCDEQEFNRQFSLGLFDYRDNHIIKVCCDQICLQRELKSLCA